MHFSKRSRCLRCGSNDIDKTRSSLLVEWLRIIREARPVWGIYENVKNIVGKEFRDTFQLFEQELQEYGYNTYWRVLNAKNYGIPQNRERIYLILIRVESDNGKFRFPKSSDTYVCLKDILEDTVDEEYYLSQEKVKRLIEDMEGRKALLFEPDEGALRRWRDEKQYPAIIRIGKINKNNMTGMVYSPLGIMESRIAAHDQPKAIEKMGNPVDERYMLTCAAKEDIVLVRQKTKKGYEECRYNGIVNLSYPKELKRGRVLENGEICPTLTTSSGIYCLESLVRIRRLTPLESFRLMGFSDEDYQKAKEAGVSKSQLYKQAGNSIVVDVLYHIFREIYTVMPYLFEDIKLSSFFSGIGAFEKALERLEETIND